MGCRHADSSTCCSLPWPSPTGLDDATVARIIRVLRASVTARRPQNAVSGPQEPDGPFARGHGHLGSQVTLTAAPGWV